MDDRYNRLTGVAVVAVSTDAQRSSSQQGINLVLEEEYIS
jgi:hypothetical protein